MGAVIAISTLGNLVRQAGIAAVFVATALFLRGVALGTIDPINPDEAELVAQARAAMRSPVPFTTWTTTTAGPFWVFFLALLGGFGLPMTIAFAHAVAAALLGLLGYLGFELVARVTGPAQAVVLTLFWWLPIVRSLTGGQPDFVALSTELLPCVLLLGAALIRPAALARNPLLYVAFGAVCGLAIGAKYQALPVAVGLLAVRLFGTAECTYRSAARRTGLWLVGAALPNVAVLLVMLVAPGVSVVALTQHLHFLTGYSGELTAAQRLANFAAVALRPHIALLLLAVCWLGARSTRRIQLARAVLVISGAAAILAGGKPFGHYLHFGYAAIVLAMALPVKPSAAPTAVPDAPAVSRIRRAWAVTTSIAVLAAAGWLFCFGPTFGWGGLLNREQLQLAQSADSVRRDARLAAVCPPGSSVLVWGWASELYVNYSWQNAIPFFNVTQLTSSPRNYASGLELVAGAAEDSSTVCVVDAVGFPFFGMAETQSLVKHYPTMAGVLERDYRPAGRVVECTACTVYVRRNPY